MFCVLHFAEPLLHELHAEPAHDSCLLCKLPDTTPPTLDLEGPATDLTIARLKPAPLLVRRNDLERLPYAPRAPPRTV